MIRMFIPVFPAVLAVYLPFCTPELRPTQPPELVQIEELWERPDDLEARDLFNGPWGARNAPSAEAVYTFIKFKTGGVNPGMTVTDPRGREWRVKQAPRDGRGHEGPIEVVLSRVLAAVGYHQPPVYYLPQFTLTDKTGTRFEPGGRFRLEHESLNDRGGWSWQRNPFVGTKPYQGLLVILLMFNSSDLKNSNNTLYEVRDERGPRRWFVVRDIGTALGSTGRVEPRRGDIDIFEREPLRRRITPDDIRWACDLMARLDAAQWRDAFRAGGYQPRLAERFIQRLLTKIDEGRQFTPTTGGG